MKKRTRTPGLIDELYPGRTFASLTSEELRHYHREWRTRNAEHVTASRVARSHVERDRRRQREADPEFMERKRAYQRAWAAKPENKRRFPGYYKKYRLRAEYGLSLEQYQAMRDEQCGTCALCHRVDSGRPKWKDLVVDHDHSTGRVRALLCHQCNMVLGHSGDNPALLRKMADYIESHWKAAEDGEKRPVHVSA